MFHILLVFMSNCFGTAYISKFWLEVYNEFEHRGSKFEILKAGNRSKSMLVIANCLNIHKTFPQSTATALSNHIAPLVRSFINAGFGCDGVNPSTK